MSKKRKTSNATFFVTRRMGRILGDHQVFRNQGRAGVGVSGGVVSSTLLYLLHLRHQWVPVRTDLVALHLGSGPIPEDLAEVASGIGVECRLVEPREGVSLPDRLMEAARDLHLDALALGDVIEDRAAAVLGSMVFDGTLAALPPITETTDQPLLVRPFAMLPEEVVLRAAEDNHLKGTPPIPDERREWLERLLAMVPGDRHDLLTNLVNAPDRVCKDYLV